MFPLSFHMLSSSNGWRQPKALIQRLQEYQTPYSFAQAEPTLQKPVFEPIHKQLYPNEISTTEGFSKRNGADSIPEATDRIANGISEWIQLFPQNPHQSDKPPPMCVKLSDGSHQKNTDNALFDRQVHVAHLNCPIDFMTFEIVENYTHWRHPNDDAFCWYRALHIQIRTHSSCEGVPVWRNSTLLSQASPLAALPYSTGTRLGKVVVVISSTIVIPGWSVPSDTSQLVVVETRRLRDHGVPEGMKKTPFWKWEMLCGWRESYVRSLDRVVREMFLTVNHTLKVYALALGCLVNSFAFRVRITLRKGEQICRGDKEVHGYRSIKGFRCINVFRVIIRVIKDFRDVIWIINEDSDFNKNIVVFSKNSLLPPGCRQNSTVVLFPQVNRALGSRRICEFDQRMGLGIPNITTLEHQVKTLLDRGAEIIERLSFWIMSPLENWKKV
ncbi:hypothetical protein BKA57DRAFT_524420, partial [Linnemannia elongata]